MKSIRALSRIALMSAALFMGAVLLSCGLARADVIVSELLASNGVITGGRSDDWLELYNDSDAAVNLSGWYLSDSWKAMGMWQFPEGTVIKAHDYLLLGCSTDTQTPSNHIYTNFSLPSSGATLYLTNPAEGGQKSEFTYPAQYGNISYGITSSGEYAYLESATPGKANDVKGCSVRACAPTIETAAGIYPNGTYVTISCDTTCEIRYTTDCSTPTKESKLYTGPIHVTSTTVIRAVACSDTELTSAIVGATYIVEDYKFTTPVISVYSDYKYLFGSANGILAKGTGKTPNYEQEIENPAQMEYFDADGVQRIVQMCTVKVSGHSSRNLKQKSLTLTARGAYGSDVFAYSFFDNRPYTEYSSILLRNTSSDYKYTRLRDAALQELADGLDVYHSAGTPVIVYINGEYYGHYNLREKWNADSLAQWEGITDDEVIAGIDLLDEAGMYDYDVLHGSNEDWVALVHYCVDNDLNDPEKLAYVEERLDIQNFFDFTIFTAIIGYEDYGNTRIYRFPGGKWRFMLHDIESSCLNLKDDPLDAYFASNSSTSALFPHWVLTELLESEECRKLFLERMAYVTENCFLYYRDVEPVFNKWMNKIQPLLTRFYSSFKYSSIKQWTTDTHAAMYYLRLRPESILNSLCDRLNVTKSEREEYLGTTFTLLKKYNSKNPPTD